MNKSLKKKSLDGGDHPRDPCLPEVCWTPMHGGRDIEGHQRFLSPPALAGSGSKSPNVRVGFPLPCCVRRLTDPRDRASPPLPLSFLPSRPCLGLKRHHPGQVRRGQRTALVLAEGASLASTTRGWRRRQRSSSSARPFTPLVAGGNTRSPLPEPLSFNASSLSLIDGGHVHRTQSSRRPSSWRDYAA